MAAAGFFQIGSEDIVQCAYCFGVVQDWQEGDNPLEIHRELFPRCPLVMGAPVFNVAATTADRCCFQHETSKAVLKKRATSTYLSGMHRTYIPALITLLLALNIAPIRAQGVTTVRPSVDGIAGNGSVMLLDRAEAFHIFEPVETWKGLLAVKKEEFWVPRSYTTYTLALKLSKCREAETKIAEALLTFRTTITHNGSAIGPSSKQKLADMLDDAADDLQKEKVQDIIDLVENGSIPSTAIEPTCQVDERHLLGEEQCTDTLREAQIVALGAATALTAIGGRLGAAAAILDLLHRYQDILKQGKELLKSMQTNEIPRELTSIFAGSCKALYQQCAGSITVTASNIYRKATKVVSVKRNEDNIFITLATPCLESGKKLSKYELKALPHMHSNYSGSFELNTPMKEIFLQEKGDKYEIVSQPLNCQKVEHFSMCQSEEDQPAIEQIHGTQDEFRVDNMIENPTSDKIDHVDLPNNELVVATTAPIRFHYQCPREKLKEQVLQGIGHVTLKPDCVLRAPGYPFQKSGSYTEDILANQLRGVNLMPNWLPFKNGRVGNGDNNISPFFPIETAEDWLLIIVYVGAAGAAAVVLSCLSVALARTYREICYHPPARDDTVYVHVPNMPR
jgi:hypothetical protein